MKATRLRPAQGGKLFPRVVDGRAPTLDGSRRSGWTNADRNMLTPRELFNAQGFPTDYNITPRVNGKPITKTAQVKCAGNSVCPPIAEAVVRANVDPSWMRKAA